MRCSSQKTKTLHWGRKPALASLYAQAWFQMNNNKELYYYELY